MDTPEAIKALLETGMTAIFAFLFWSERKRVKDVQEARIAEHKRWIDVLTAIIFKDMPDTSSAIRERLHSDPTKN